MNEGREVHGLFLFSFLAKYLILLLYGILISLFVINHFFSFKESESNFNR